MTESPRQASQAVTSATGGMCRGWPQASVRNLTDVLSTLLGTRVTNQTGGADEAHTLTIQPQPSRGEVFPSLPPSLWFN